MPNEDQKFLCNQDAIESNFSVGPCSPIQAYPIQFYVSPNYEGPEIIRILGEAECVSESVSDEK